MREKPDRPASNRLGLAMSGLGLVALAVLPFTVYRPNRIAAGQPRDLLAALPADVAGALVVMVATALLLSVFSGRATLRLIAAGGALSALAAAVGISASHLTPAGAGFARVSPGAGFWLLLLALGLIFTDALARLRFGPLARLMVLAATAAAIAMLLRSGVWNDLSFVREYASQPGKFWREGGRHVVLAFGSLGTAIVIGLPLGVLCHRLPRVRHVSMQVLNLIQTIPSMAMFGILMAPLGVLGAHSPLATQIGIQGIGIAPAFVALSLYSLLPLVANTVVGLAQTPSAIVDAARGMGFTARQRLLYIELPLALPFILTGVRIVLVQNIGLATVAALIGGGGFGVFIFQGIGQTAMDLVMLGAVPTVAMAFAASVILDAAVDLAGGRRP
jgi:osmoprotectant transport system permease protein